MHSFKDLSVLFSKHFEKSHFPSSPHNLYEPCNYFLQIGGKRVRPTLCLLGNELFDTIHIDSYHIATAIELFHNFTLVHDDMMDAASLRRGMQTVHTKYNSNIALLSGDVMLIKAYEYINKIQPQYLQRILQLFNTTATEVCEGQQLDMDFENQDEVSLNEYIKMIELKTSVLLAAALQMGAIIGGASEGNCNHLYQFGLNLGIAFQIQDDYLDAFGDPEKFGKEVGGDIKQNKKTFLLLHSLEVASAEQRKRLHELMKDNPSNKVEEVLKIYTECNVQEWTKNLKQKYFDTALQHLEDIAVVSSRKKPLLELAYYLIDREH
ncbi:MAG: polyprenyl synthetase family protein [Chitinophagaceae bacterium]|nr:polyprenyl synthetase family protein [Chitinophagaceae bacterium]